MRKPKSLKPIMRISSKGSDLSYVTLNFLVTSKILSVESKMDVFASKAISKM